MFVLKKNKIILIYLFTENIHSFIRLVAVISKYIAANFFRNVIHEDSI